MAEVLKRFENYNSGLHFLLDWFRQHTPHGLLGLIINGAGINVGKSQLMNDIWLQSGLIHDQVVDWEYGQRPSLRRSDQSESVMLGLMQAQMSGSFGNRGHQMAGLMRNEMTRQMHSVVKRNPTGLLLVNIESREHRFPADAVPADVWILNELAQRDRYKF
jgi:hypothetical protein